MLKIYHGPLNIAGIGRRLADWQRKQGAISDFITYFTDSPIVRKSHLSFNLNRYGRFTRAIVIILFFLQCLFKYDVFHFYSGRSMLPFNLDLPILRLFRKKIIMTYCGSDIRLIEIERKRNPYWHLIKSVQDGLEYDTGKKWMMRWHRLWVHRVIAPRNIYKSAREIFPPEKIERDLWLHNLMDMKAYEPSSYETKTPPVVVHAPSHKGLKGTEYVERAIEELKKDGVAFEYRRIEGVENQEALRIYREDADIIMDQFIIGGFGTLAVEGMYYGKPVMCYLIDEVKQDHYPDVPIVNATIDDLKMKLAWLIENPEERIRLGKEGRVYVESHFDNEKVNAKIWNMYHRL